MTCKNAAIQVQLQRPNDHQIKKVFIVLGLLLSCFTISAQDRRRIWTDSIFQTLTLQEKIGQLFMLKVQSTRDHEETETLLEEIQTWHIGGIWIQNGGPKSTAALIDQAQRLSKIPLLTGIKAGTGLGESLDSTISFLKPVSIGAIRNDSIVYEAGEIIAGQMKLLGLHINFASNTSVWKREAAYENYYSDNMVRVARKSLNIMHGLQDHGVIACAFPPPKAVGKTNDGRDSIHIYDPGRSDSADLHTNVKLVQSGVGAVLTSSFSFSLLEGKKAVRSSFSAEFINRILRDEMGFQGLVLCEIPPAYKPVKGEKKKKKGELELMALAAGNDMLIDPQNMSQAFKFIQKSLKKNKTLMVRLDAAVKKILETKFDAGLAVRPQGDRDNLIRKLNTPGVQLFRHQLAEATITVVRNSFSSIPVRQLEDRKFVSLSVGRSGQNEFSRYLGKYTGFESLSVATIADTVGVALKLRSADVVVVGIFPQSYEFQAHLLPLLQTISAKKNVILCFFGNPEGLKVFPGFPSVIASYTDDDLVQKITAEIVFGGMKSYGALPVSISPSLREGFGIVTPLSGRLSYTLPEAAGMDSQTLEQITAIAEEAIDMKATPGCQVLVARRGKVIYDKPFGYLTYEKKSPVTDETLFDLASVTKVSATLQAVMFMQEKGLIDINKKLSVYMPEFRKSNKKDFTLKDILTHQAGLWPFLPFWAQTVKDTVLLPLYYRKKPSADFPYPVAAGLYASRAMRDSLLHWIINAKIVEKPNRVPYDYKYSDMGLFVLMFLAEKMLNQPMDQFLDQNFYEVLGASTTGYLPLLKFPASRIAPTENDKLFRKSQLVGYVHDQMAAMNGGVAGHAGLFSTANDLAKLGQMWLQKGSYAGHRYFKPETMDLFTRKQFEYSRRGIGWDKPTVSDPNGPTSAYASAQTFGHTGFTGISIWIDPEFDLVFIFFSNRVYPEMTNNKILNANIRPRVQDIVYRSIFNYCANHN